MKVLIVSANESAPWGASEEVWFQFALRLLQMNAQVIASVKGWHSEAPALGLLERAGGVVLRRWQALAFEYRPIYELPDSERLESTLERVCPDFGIISQGDNREGLGWMEEFLRRRIPYVIITHSTTEHDWPFDDIAMRLQRGYLSARACFFVSPHNLQVTEKQITAKLDHARVIFTPCKVPFTLDPLPWPNDSETIKLACVARLDPQTKGQDILFEILQQTHWRERALHVTLYGDGDNRLVLQALCKLWNIEQTITFGGHVANIPEIWQNHHMLILPSRIEGRPAVIAEAMLCGRPAIVTDTAGNTDFLEDNVTGFIAEAPTVKHFAEAMERAWQMRKNWKQMGLAAAHAIREVLPPDPVGLFVDDLTNLFSTSR